MLWISENKEWFFSGIGATIVAAFIARFNKKNNERKAPQENKQSPTINNTIVNQIGLSPNTTTSPHPMVTNFASVKSSTHILFIDDQKFDHISVLRNDGWINTKSIKTVKRIDCPEILTANVIFIDVNGVGCELFPKEQGLGVAKKIKQLYPEKFVVIYSAQLHPLDNSFTSLDGVLPKNADPYQYTNILEEFTAKLLKK